LRAAQDRDALSSVCGILTIEVLRYLRAFASLEQNSFSLPEQKLTKHSSMVFVIQSIVVKP
jgi:hypothetical protein